MAFRWRAGDGPTLNAGLVALWFFRGSGPVLQRNSIFLWFLRGGGLDPLPPPPSLDPHMTSPDEWVAAIKIITESYYYPPPPPPPPPFQINMGLLLKSLISKWLLLTNPRSVSDFKRNPRSGSDCFKNNRSMDDCSKINSRSVWVIAF